MPLVILGHPHLIIISTDWITNRPGRQRPLVLCRARFFSQIIIQHIPRAFDFSLTDQSIDIIGQLGFGPFVIIDGGDSTVLFFDVRPFPIDEELCQPQVVAIHGTFLFVDVKPDIDLIYQLPDILLLGNNVFQDQAQPILIEHLG